MFEVTTVVPGTIDVVMRLSTTPVPRTEPCTANVITTD
jgi:hypothetical protein